ncbi:hypothetical protein D623_10026969 [Myotis brandtii]|uniref:Uncharacterized protein n=1 Tax=Myotis brandtii TaxID=109478 RepID=S7PS25_MYOBR|nr:hypothetical protein D623_10026969 [Myotis brandtii]
MQEATNRLQKPGVQSIGKEKKKDFHDRPEKKFLKISWLLEDVEKTAVPASKQYPADNPTASSDLEDYVPWKETENRCRPEIAYCIEELAEFVVFHVIRAEEREIKRET